MGKAPKGPPIPSLWAQGALLRPLCSQRMAWPLTPQAEPVTDGGRSAGEEAGSQACAVQGSTVGLAAHSPGQGLGQRSFLKTPSADKCLGRTLCRPILPHRCRLHLSTRWLEKSPGTERVEPEDPAHRPPEPSGSTHQLGAPRVSKTLRQEKPRAAPAPPAPGRAPLQPGRPFYTGL